MKGPELQRLDQSLLNGVLSELEMAGPEQSRERRHQLSCLMTKEMLELARRVCAYVGVPESLITFVPDRPGHDFRYGVGDGRIRALGWRPEIPFDDGLASTVAWYRDNLEWLRRGHEGAIVTAPRGAPA